MKAGCAAACFALFFSACFAAENFEEKKIERVLSRLQIPTGQKILDEKADFLRDLKVALAADKDGLLVLVDKKHFLPSNFVPADLIPLVKNSLYNINRNDLSLRRPVCEALDKMASAAQKDGIALLVSSTYRSYEYQKNLFQRWVKIDGLAEAERESAREGSSQHQLGTAIDFGSITDDFIETRQGKWLSSNAAKYGFSLSFPQGFEDETGFRWECWHYRYIGVEAAALQKKWFGDVQQHMMEFIDEWSR